MFNFTFEGCDDPYTPCDGFSTLEEALDAAGEWVCEANELGDYDRVVFYDDDKFVMLTDADFDAIESAWADEYERTHGKSERFMGIETVVNRFFDYLEEVTR